ncbi:DNA phosphorothioation-dependent restriction protein DptG [Pseudomonas panipatensis]|uniref:DNA phosphorothioation-dependent restriction protein DptG n=2 Tax=Pseudomonas panipatensis TaxID=428992 RepID=A0A1G8G4W1_9PSED|nr:DNA phosphorothioation-dependent restriction protein DptG [Pseudomonas panipatensis]SMP45349.1 DNA phosphorothioation-dependent restriction protein DptG [Pseudomonas panipatensis]
MSRIDEPEFWNVLDKMYFANQDVFKVSPLFLLFKAQFDGSGRSELGPANWRMGTLFSSLLGDYRFSGEIQESLNFIEREFLAVLESKLLPSEQNAFNREQPYLPYISQAFKKDISFLTMHPQYLLQELGNMLKLYAFTYCAQLALNVRNWRDGEPKSRALFFILDTEKASSERAMVQHHGYKMFAKSCEWLFPILSSLEALQQGEEKRPLWQVYAEAQLYPDHVDLLRELNSYIQAFIERRKLPERSAAENLEAAFVQLQDVAIEQFRDEKTDRFMVNKKYMAALESQICSEFIQSRGRAGRVLVITQDQLLLLTNLAIGKNEKLRLHELMREFEQRGFYLDSQSQQVLVAFYERMGNVDRMSDSGDAVYVRKTV